MADRPILIISGTNRPHSNTLRVSKTVLEHYQQLHLPAEMYDLTELPREVFEPTVYDSRPKAFVQIQQLVLDSAGLHMVMPEYNGSYPGILKYFVDLLEFSTSFDRKPVACVGLSDGMFGAARAVDHMQMVLAHGKAHLYPERVFIPRVREKLDADGKIKDPTLNERLIKQIRGFAEFAGMIKDGKMNAEG